MAYDEKLAERIRGKVARRRGIEEKKMFGGVAFLANGNMFCGVSRDDLMVRVGPDAHEAALARKHARPMDITGRPMKGMVFVSAPGVRTSKQLDTWIERGLEFARSLPKK